MTLSNRHSLIFFIIIFILYLLIALAGDIAHRPGWGDEVRLHATVIEFSENFSLDYLRTYNQLSTPLPFIIYSGWGKIFGLELFHLRILSIIIALTTFMLFFKILEHFVKDRKLLFFGSIFLAIHPYNVGLSIFVFTDMIAVLFLLLGFLGVIRKSLWLTAIGLAASILCRQYLVFILPPVFIFLLLKWLKDKDKRELMTLAGTILSITPFAALVIFWGGISPDNQWREFYSTEKLYFHPEILFLYIMLLAVYLLPYLILTFRRLIKSKLILFLSILISPLYFLSPIEPSKYSVAINVHTVGLFHKALKFLTDNDTIIQTIFFIFFWAGLLVLSNLIGEGYKLIKNKDYPAKLNLIMITVSFMIIMPLSYLGWEKYFMPLLPFLIILFSLLISENQLKSEKSG